MTIFSTNASRLRDRYCFTHLPSFRPFTQIAQNNSQSHVTKLCKSSKFVIITLRTLRRVASPRKRLAQYSRQQNHLRSRFLSLNYTISPRSIYRLFPRNLLRLSLGKNFKRHHSEKRIRPPLSFLLDRSENYDLPLLQPCFIIESVPKRFHPGVYEKHTLISKGLANIR